MNDEYALEISNLFKSYDGLVAVNNIDFKVKSGSITGLIGPNGCGKSTTFNAITGLIPYQRGNVLIYGQEASHLPSDKINLLGLSRTFQNTRLWRNLTVMENILLPPKNQLGTRIRGLVFPKSVKEVEDILIEKAYNVLEILEIDHMAFNKASELSGGQSKLVDIARVMMSNPRVLLLDEPVAGVAGPLVEKIFQQLDNLRKITGVTIFIIEHNLEFILGTGIDFVYVMNLGKILTSGTPEEILKHKGVAEIYLGY